MEILTIANDTYGHQAGDRILKGVALKLKASLRGSDFLARFGGDEFAILITQTTMEQAIKINERILATFMEYKFGDTSLSCGVGEFARDQGVSWQENINQFLKQVDKALYEAKNAGRGRISSGNTTHTPQN